jgi:hypothetical protein
MPNFVGNKLPAFPSFRVYFGRAGFILCQIKEEKNIKVLVLA